MPTTVLNLKATGNFEINLDNGVEIALDTSSAFLQPSQLSLMNEIIDDLQEDGFNEILFL